MSDELIIHDIKDSKKYNFIEEYNINYTNEIINFKEYLKSIIQNKFNMRSLTINNVKIEKTNKTIKEYISNLMEININNSLNIEYVYKRMNINSNIVKLEIENNKIKNTFYINGKYFPNLKYLNIGFNKIENVKIEDIKLETLICQNNKIKKLIVPSISKKINIDNNLLEEIDENILPELVYMNNNKLKQLKIKSDIIQIIYIENNKLKWINIESKSLYTLYLRNNEINNIKLETPELEHLNIENNKLQNLYMKNDNIRIIEANNNLIHRVNINCKSLSMLSLKNNKIKDEWFSIETPELYELFIDYNYFRNINPQLFFTTMKGLDYIQMTGNKIKKYKISIKNKKNTECPICLTVKKKLKYITYCRHLFCIDCIKWIKNRCAICNARILYTDEYLRFYRK
jgi:Leucine-rich repeat (LRR) protein